MSIEFTCKYCQRMLRVGDESQGKKCRCPACKSVLDVPLTDTEEDSIVLADLVTVSSTRDGGGLSEMTEGGIEGGSRVVDCPKCSSSLRYSAPLVGTRGVCKVCKTIFTLGAEKSVGEKELTQSQESFAFECPKCRFMFEGRDGMEGRKGKCTECHEVFSIVRLTTDSKSSASSPKPGGKVETKIPLPPVKVREGQPTAAGERVKSARPSSLPAAPKVNVSPKKGANPDRLAPPKKEESTESVWDKLNLPHANWENTTGNSALSPYHATASYTGVSRRKGLLKDREKLFSVAYWHRAVIVSFVIQILIVLFMLPIVFGMQYFAEELRGQQEIVIGLLIFLGVLALISVTFSIRFAIGFVVLSVHLYETWQTVLLIIAFFFLGWIPFVSLICLILVLARAYITLKAVGYEVGFFGVEPEHFYRKI